MDRKLLRTDRGDEQVRTDHSIHTATGAASASASLSSETQIWPRGRV